MRRWLILGYMCFSCAMVVGCDDDSASSPASADERTDLDFFATEGDRPLLHFRVRYWGDTLGQRPGPDGSTQAVKTYVKGTPWVADFYVEPGAERLAIVEASPGRKIALYFTDLRVVDGHAEAGLHGYAMNFKYQGPPSKGSGSKQRVERGGSMDAPKPKLYHVGQPQVAVIGQHGYTFESEDAPMGSDYSVVSQEYFSIELVEITDLASAMKADEELQTMVPLEVWEEVQRDMPSISLPSKR